MHWTTQTVRDQILRSQGPVVTYRSIRHGKRSARKIAKSQYDTAVQSLTRDGLGTMVEFKVPRARGPCRLFIKNIPNQWPTSTNVSAIEDINAIARPMHSDITANMREYLERNYFY